MKALILAAEGFEDLELFGLLHRLREEQIDVTLASPTGTKITGSHGYHLETDMPIREINPGEYDLLVVPGGSSPERLRLREEAVGVARTFMEDDRRVAVVGRGIQLLISAGALNGRQVTCSPAIRDDVRAAGANYRDQSVVVDGNLLSCRGIDELPDFCRQLVATLLIAQA
jgi:protease I